MENIPLITLKTSPTMIEPAGTKTVLATLYIPCGKKTILHPAYVARIELIAAESSCESTECQLIFYMVRQIRTHYHHKR